MMRSASVNWRISIRYIEEGSSKVPIIVLLAEQRFKRSGMFCRATILLYFHRRTDFPFQRRLLIDKLWCRNILNGDTDGFVSVTSSVLLLPGFVRARTAPISVGTTVSLIDFSSSARRMSPHSAIIALRQSTTTLDRAMVAPSNFP